MKKFIPAALLAAAVILLPFTVNKARADDEIPSVDVTYTEDWEGTLLLDQNQTVKISGITHSNDGTEYRSPIQITNGATVNLIFEGQNVLTGNQINNSAYCSAGIQVDNGATVHIYGLEGSSLTVTGGTYGAGIGSVGNATIIQPDTPAGAIYIHSGNITAYGGQGSAGIGSGARYSASVISILGGNIRAMGKAGGAGIGSGYGTSGSSAVLSGSYTGGTITIGGSAEVFAAAYPIDFDDFDPYNLDTLYNSEEYSGAYGAGIGGGYGSSSGNIVIEGSAKVTAIGATGGAGIGSGYGTSKIIYFDAEHYFVDITIRENAEVMAFAGEEKRTQENPSSGAAIGHGRFTGLKDTPVGSIRIEDNAKVYAVAAQISQAIGSSYVSFKEAGSSSGGKPSLGQTKTVSISPTATVIALSDGFADPIDKDKVQNFAVLEFPETLFEDFSTFFTEDKFPMKVEAADPEDPDNKALFALGKPALARVMANLGGASELHMIVKDYQDDDGNKIYFASSALDAPIRFTADGTEASVDFVTSELTGGASLETAAGELTVRFHAPAGVFKLGSVFHAAALSEDDAAMVEALIDEGYLENLEKLFLFDLGVADPAGDEYTALSDTADLYILLEDGWEDRELKLLFPLPEEDEDYAGSIETVDGQKYYKAELTHFSPYAFLIYEEDVPDTGDGGLPVFFWTMGLAAAGLLTLYLTRRKRVK